jgi:hypothetical protein
VLEDRPTRETNNCSTLLLHRTIATHILHNNAPSAASPTRTQHSNIITAHHPWHYLLPTFRHSFNALTHGCSEHGRAAAISLESRHALALHTPLSKLSPHASLTYESFPTATAETKLRPARAISDGSTASSCVTAVDVRWHGVTNVWWMWCVYFV